MRILRSSVSLLPLLPLLSLLSTLSLLSITSSSSCPLSSVSLSSSPPLLLSSLSLQGSVPHTSRDFFVVPFVVPFGTKEIQIQHKSVNSTRNILDFGLIDPAGTQRGWGGGSNALVIVNEFAASPSYEIGPIFIGTWDVLVGLPQIEDAPGWYDITVCLLGDTTLSPQTERSPYSPSPPLKMKAQWYAGKTEREKEIERESNEKK